jgi:hypothetical protein
MQPTTKDIRIFALILGLLTLVFGCLQLVKGRPGVAHVLICISVGISAGGCCLPKALLPLYRGWMYVATGVGWFNTRLLLGLIFFLLFLPLGLVFRVLGKDPLARKVDGKRESYWNTRESPPLDPKNYERQF